jgi:PQQ-dependent dehydrogenase (methanol/ethanol family)
LRSSIVLAVTVTAAALLTAAAAAAQTALGDWPSYNGSPDGERYSPLTELTPRNAGRLRRICTFDTGERTAMETGPVAVGGTLYVTTDTLTFALDGATCALRWRHARTDSVRPSHSVNRGVVYVETASGPRVVRGSGDAHVYALDARTGAIAWDVAVGDATRGETISAAPAALGGLIFIGTAGGDYAGVTGRIFALDVADGHTVWRFGVVPAGGTPALSWPDPVPDFPRTGGGTWSTYTVDTAAQFLIVATGNPAPLFTSHFHAGENLFTESVLILDVWSGSIFRLVTLRPHDIHDWDLAAAPVLLTTASGASLIAVAGKDGYLAAIQRPTGTTRYRVATTTILGADAPITPAGTRFCPGTLGGTDWNGPAYDRAHNMLLVGAVDWCTTVRRRALDTMRAIRGRPWTAHTDSTRPYGLMDQRARSHGWLTAFDADMGTIRWRYPSPAPLVAGVTATAGGLVLTADLRGTVLALDAATGTVRYRGRTEQPVGGGVITYLAHGRQRVAVASGMTSSRWRTKSTPATIVVFGIR